MRVHVKMYNFLYVVVAGGYYLDCEYYGKYLVLHFFLHDLLILQPYLMLPFNYLNSIGSVTYNWCILLLLFSRSLQLPVGK